MQLGITFAKQNSFMKKSILILFLNFILVGLHAQDITGKYQDGKPVVVIPAEGNITLTDFAKMYKAKPADVAKYNGLKVESNVAAGQKLVLPVAGLLQPNTAENGYAVYHIVQPKEGLFRIGVNYGDIKMPVLKSLNNLSGESVSIGQRLLIGYLPKYSAVSSEAIAANTEADKIAPPLQNTLTINPAIKEIKPTLEPQQTGGKNLQSADLSVPDNSVSGKGFFEINYKETGIHKEGLGAIFKSTSGWADGKYYVLMNDILPGTVIKITNPDNGNFLFARVVGDLPVLKKQPELMLRLSNSATAVLGILAEDNFKLSVSY